MRIPSASFCQRSVILLSSSSAIFEYMVKRSPELSRKWSPAVSRRRSPELLRKWSPPEPPRGVWNDTERGRSKRPFPIHRNKNWRGQGKRWGTYRFHSYFQYPLVDLLPVTLKPCREIRTPRGTLNDSLVGPQQRVKHASSTQP